MPQCKNCGNIFKRSYVGSYETLCEDCWKLLRKKGREKTRRTINKRMNKCRL